MCVLVSINAGLALGFPSMCSDEIQWRWVFSVCVLVSVRMDVLGMCSGSGVWRSVCVCALSVCVLVSIDGNGVGCSRYACVSGSGVGCSQF